MKIGCVFMHSFQIFGAYTLKIYGINLHFFVMNNLFLSKDENGQNIAIHEKYDIKGSTVNRSSVPPSEGQSCTCRHCEQKFTYEKKKKSKSRLGAVRVPFDSQRSASHNSATISSDIEDFFDLNKLVAC